MADERLQYLFSPISGQIRASSLLSSTRHYHSVLVEKKQEAEILERLHLKKGIREILRERFVGKGKGERRK